ncbi:hypothetical protein Taro_010378 [Colocasia esculenta]|uniref:DUF8040 domain-containing protein n=1 Tax=Colocasia esculenta TaxID=4460 RepID=A0A843U2X9_COLES|nr:hypothetical protein [Colocasia esculenta]
MNNTPTSLANMGSSSPKRKPASIGNKGRGKKKAQSNLDNLVDVTSESAMVGRVNKVRVPLSRDRTRSTFQCFFVCMRTKRNLLFNILQEDEEIYTAVLNVVLEELQEEVHPTIPRRMMNTSKHTGELWVQNILNGHQKRCYNVFRVHPSMFISLVDMLVSKSLLKDS